MNASITRRWILPTVISLSALFAPGTHAQPTGPGYALSFDGNASYVSSGAPIPSSGDFTVECWALAPFPTSSARDIVFQRGQGGAATAFYMGTDSGNNIQLGPNWATGIAFPFTNWHHFAVVKTTTDTVLYIDGVRKASHGSAVLNPSGPTPSLTFGEDWRNNNAYWQGRIDEVRIWSAARTQTEISNNMSHPLTGSETGLQGYWRLDEGSGSITADSTGHGYAGSWGGANSPAWVLSGIPFQPTVATSNAAGIMATKATILGGVNPGNLPTSAYFQWGATAAYGNTTPVTVLPATNSTVPVSGNITNLAAATTYHFRLVATNTASTNSGTDQTFATLSTNANLASLTLIPGTITPDFDPGITNYTSSVAYAVTNISVTATSADANAHILLILDVRYNNLVSGSPSPPLGIKVGPNYYTIIVFFLDGPATRTYTLAINRAGIAPSATTLPASAITSQGATLNGSVNPNGSITTAWFEWGTTTNYGSFAGSTNLANNSSPTPMQAFLTSLMPGTIYYFRVAATNTAGSNYGADEAFFPGLIVSNLADSGAGSLRQAIVDAAPGDRIAFSVTGTNTLTSSELLLDKDLTIIARAKPTSSSAAIMPGGCSIFPAASRSTSRA